MDMQSFAFVNELMRIVNEQGDTRSVVEKFLSVLRQQFVFDNVAAYLQDEETGALDIVYARAIGRAKTAEADAAWGESIGAQVLVKTQLLIQEPDEVRLEEGRNISH